MPDVNDVFDAGGFPEYTYVERERNDLQTRLDMALNSSTPAATIVGPSKSGKTMLVKGSAKKEEYQVIQIRGAQIDSLDKLWNLVLDELGAPDNTQEQVSESTEQGSRTKGSAGASSTSIAHDHHSKEVEREGQFRDYSRGGFSEIETRAAREDFVILIDDFHFIESEEVQRSIARSMKGAIEAKIPFCVTFVNHRGETLQELVPNLDSRVMRISCKYWDESELERIAELGEQALRIKFPDWLKTKLASNAVRSPMIMQRLCNAACDIADVEDRREADDEIYQIDISTEDFDEIRYRAALWMGKRSVVRSISRGVNDSGRERYDYGGKEKGDIYILGLRAIASGSTTRSFDFSDLKQRIREDCNGDYPNAPQINNFCKGIENIVEEERPGEDLVEWDSENDVLLVSDPELLFLIRYMLRDDDFRGRLRRD